MSIVHNGNLLGGTLLIGGSCIGAAMLGLPVMTASSGFIPSETMFLLAWAFMLATGLLMLEANLWLGPGVSIVSMADRTMGKWGRYSAWGLFLFLFYAVMVALISGSGALLHSLLSTVTVAPSLWIVETGFVLLFGIFVFFGTGSVDRLNRLMMIALVVTYILMLGIGLPEVSGDLLAHQNWCCVGFLLPAMAFSFGYHNLIPSLTDYLHGNPVTLKRAIIFGSLIPLVVYFFWQMLVLGTIPPNQMNGLTAPEVMQACLGTGWLTILVDTFSLFAALTTLIGVVLSFVDFLADGLDWEKDPKERTFLCSLVLIPPLLVSITYPGLFLRALSVAGGFGAVSLFGLLPAIMVWRGRYHLNLHGPRMLPGGKFSLVLILIISLMIIGLEALQELGLSPLSQNIETQG